MNAKPVKVNLKVKTAVKAGSVWRNHNRGLLKVTTALKAGGSWHNHNRRLVTAV